MNKSSAVFPGAENIQRKRLFLFFFGFRKFAIISLVAVPECWVLFFLEGVSLNLFPNPPVSRCDADNLK